MRTGHSNDNSFFGTDSIWAVLRRIAPPVMVAQLVQALYNIVDSLFIGHYSPDGLTALSVIFPVQLVLTALAVGTGVGVNTLMARQYALGKDGEANETAGTGTVLALLSWILFSIVMIPLMEPYVRTSANIDRAVDYAVTYGSIVCAGSVGLFLESIWSKVHQAEGNMRLPMYAQLVGAIVNIILDYILIFGCGPIPEMGVEGAALATVAGQCCAAVIVGVSGSRMPPSPRTMMSHARPIYRLGYPSIVMQSLYTVYIVILNMILAGFCDEAVTVLGLYYKLQTFFFIPLMALSTCVVPVLSYNFARKEYGRCKELTDDCLKICVCFMTVGFVCFIFLPEQLIDLFSGTDRVVEIGIPAFRWIGLSFFSAALSLFFPVFFQAIGGGRASVLLSLTRQIFVMVPVFWAFSFVGLDYVWIAFPAAETTAGLLGLYLYRRQLSDWARSSGRSIRTL